MKLYRENTLHFIETQKPYIRSQNPKRNDWLKQTLRNQGNKMKKTISFLLSIIFSCLSLYSFENDLEQLKNLGYIRTAQEYPDQIKSWKCFNINEGLSNLQGNWTIKDNDFTIIKLNGTFSLTYYCQNENQKFELKLYQTPSIESAEEVLLGKIVFNSMMKPAYVKIGTPESNLQFFENFDKTNILGIFGNTLFQLKTSNANFDIIEFAKNIGNKICQVNTETYPTQISNLQIKSRLIEHIDNQTIYKSTINDFVEIIFEPVDPNMINIYTNVLSDSETVRIEKIDNYKYKVGSNNPASIRVKTIIVDKISLEFQSNEHLVEFIE